MWGVGGVETNIKLAPLPLLYHFFLYNAEVWEIHMFLKMLCFFKVEKNLKVNFQKFNLIFGGYTI
jgi:hypothetical protein